MKLTYQSVNHRRQMLVLAHVCVVIVVVACISNFLLMYGISKSRTAFVEKGMALYANPSFYVPRSLVPPRSIYPSFYEYAVEYDGDDWRGRIGRWLGSGGVPVICVAAATSEPEVLEKLVDSRSINARDVYGRTPLMYAAHSGQIGSIILLLEKGADPNAMDVQGNSVVLSAFLRTEWDGSHYDLRKDRLQVLRALLAHGANPCAHGPAIRSPTDLASECRHDPKDRAIFQLLKQYKCMIQKTLNYRETL